MSPLKPLTYFGAECDFCGDDLFDGHDYAAWSDAGHALDVVRDGEALVLNHQDDTVIVCRECQSRYPWPQDDEAREKLDEDLEDHRAEAVTALVTWFKENPAT